MPDDRVNPIWKYVAVTSLGIILGGLPGYAQLSMERHNLMTRSDVDQEINNRTEAILQSIADLKEKVNDLAGEVHEINKYQTTH